MKWKPPKVATMVASGSTAKFQGSAMIKAKIVSPVSRKAQPSHTMERGAKWAVASKARP